MNQFSDRLSGLNIDTTLEEYLASIEPLGESIANLRGIRLFEALKRDEVCAGPYPNVSLSEAANRIMTDLVILYGVRWILRHSVFPFDTYIVEYGNDAQKGFDIRATSDSMTLIGEAFNVAPSYFQGKKSAMLRKLREPAAIADFKLVMFNHDALTSNYSPVFRDTEFFVIVRIGTDEARIVPDRVRKAVVGS